MFCGDLFSHAHQDHRWLSWRGGKHHGGASLAGELMASEVTFVELRDHSVARQQTLDPCKDDNALRLRKHRNGKEIQSTQISTCPGTHNLKGERH